MSENTNPNGSVDGSISGAANAFELGSISYINTRRANFYAKVTVNTISTCSYFIFFEFMSIFSSYIIVSYHYGVFIQQYALHAAIRANYQTNLFSKPPIDKKENGCK